MTLMNDLASNKHPNTDSTHLPAGQRDLVTYASALEPSVDLGELLAILDRQEWQ